MYKTSDGASERVLGPFKDKPIVTQESGPYTLRECLKVTYTEGELWIPAENLYILGIGEKSEQSGSNL
jgi:hypothetical protein